MDTTILSKVKCGAAESADAGLASFAGLLVYLVDLDVFLGFSFSLYFKEDAG